MHQDIYDRKDNIKIINNLKSGDKFSWASTLVLDPNVDVIDVNKNLVKIKLGRDIITVKVNDGFEINIEDVWVSEIYNNKIKSKALRVSSNSEGELRLNTEITIN